MFIGLLAYDWLRVLIWFDHMGLRVATLVNLSFLGGDRARRGGGALPRPRRAHPRHPRRHPAFRHLGAAAHSLLHPARRGLGQGLDRRRGAVARRRDARARCKALAVAYGVAGVAHRRDGAASSPPRARETARRADAGPRRRARGAQPTGRAASPSTTARSAVELMRDGRGAAYVMADERGGFAIDLIRRPLDPLQARGHFFYLMRGRRSAVVDRLSSRRAAPATIAVEQIGFNRFRIANTIQRRARDDGGRRPTPQGAVLSWRIRLAEPRPAGRAALRLVSFCEIAGHETGAYARDLDFAGMHVETIVRARAQRDPRAQSPAALGARRSRRDLVLRGEARRRRADWSATRIRARVSSAKARSPAPTGCEPWRARKTRTTRASCGPSIPPPASRLEVELAGLTAWPRPNSSSAAPTTRSGPAELIARRLGLPPIAEADLQMRLLRDARRRAVAGAARRAGPSPSRPTARRCISPIARRGPGRM